MNENKSVKEKNEAILLAFEHLDSCKEDIKTIVKSIDKKIAVKKMLKIILSMFENIFLLMGCGFFVGMLISMFALVFVGNDSLPPILLFTAGGANAICICFMSLTDTFQNKIDKLVDENDKLIKLFDEMCIANCKLDLEFVKNNNDLSDLQSRLSIIKQKKQSIEKGYIGKYQVDLQCVYDYLISLYSEKIEEINKLGKQEKINVLNKETYELTQEFSNTMVMDLGPMVKIKRYAYTDTES